MSFIYDSLGNAKFQNLVDFHNLFLCFIKHNIEQGCTGIVFAKEIWFIICIKNLSAMIKYSYRNTGLLHLFITNISYIICVVNYMKFVSLCLIIPISSLNSFKILIKNGIKASEKSLNLNNKN